MAALKIEGLSKRYQLGITHAGSLAEAVRRITRRVRGKPAIEPPIGENSTAVTNEFWALRDVSFEIPRGQVVGVIGRNGAGKSTLLKVLSRVTAPTSGRVTIEGRVGSLLEVGTGFHPELTGRENVYMNATLLGMSRREVNRNLEEIIDFAGVGEHLDTPVKRYSSGMKVRLGFAVAAHLEPEVLIVDEVLSVGDAEFQKKCLGKMKQVAGHGRTVLFVSHNMGSVQQLCDRAILLQKGEVTRTGGTAEVIEAYLRRATDKIDFSRNPDTEMAIISGQIVSQNPNSTPCGGVGDKNGVIIDLTIRSAVCRNAAIDVRLSDGTGVPVGFGSVGGLQPSEQIALSRGLNPVQLLLNTDCLSNGHYFLSFDLNDPGVRYFDRAEDALRLEVARGGSGGGGRAMQQCWGFGSTLFRLKHISPPGGPMVAKPDATERFALDSNELQSQNQV